MIANSPYCADCPRKYRPILGDGPQPAEVLIIGERPGADEHKYGRVFIGKTGQELNETYLPLAGMRRCDVRVTNAVRCWADNNRTPTDKEIDCCGRHHLPHELDTTQPEIVMLMGGSACRLAKGIRLDMQHGIPQWGKVFNWQGWIVPMYHPALGLHESKWMTQLLEDWQQLPKRLSVASPDKQPYPTNYRIVRGLEVNELTLGRVVPTDTESHGEQAFSVQCGEQPGHAFMVLAEDAIGLGALQDRIRQRTGILHNAVHDLDELARLGLHFAYVRDTMQEAYHLGNLPQGLKPLTYRLFGHVMTSWEDVVRPYSIEALLAWMVEALEVAQADLSLIEVKRLKTKVRETVKKGPLEALLNRLFTHVDATSEYDPWERLDGFWADESNEWMTAHVEARIGRYPILGIGNAPLQRAVEYACGDADWTGQVAAELERQRKHDYWRVRPSDVDE